MTMGKQPAVVFIARHGARLDQADRNWQASADAPYDTPLSYGGWIQCQSLGVRIGNELSSLDKQCKAASGGDDSPSDLQPRKKRKVIIHSSPYLRCVQTSIAIAAGLQHPQHHARQRMKSRHLSTRPNLSSPEEEVDPLQLPSESDRTSSQRTNSQEDESTNLLGYDNCRLRIDSFLGEWLSPSYFDPASAPPPSAVLVSQAKMTLQKPQEEIHGADLSSSLNFNVPLPEAEEKENESTAMPVPEKTGLRAMAAVGHSLPKRPRNISFGTELANGARILNKALQRPLGYIPPAPTYAIGSSDKIPPGFVAHARDKCVEVDRDWDSENEPLNWGDGGGPFDEEWSSMHRRFRNGLQKLIAFYETEAGGKGPDTCSKEDDEELVVILVSHQAGCNALIRLFTGAPALHDVGLSSLTMAVRTDKQQILPNPVSPTRRRGSLDLAISDDYNMKIIASTEHLRGGSNPLGLNSPRLGKSPAFASRRAVGAESPEGFSLGESLSARGSGSLKPTRSVSQRSNAPEALDTSEGPTGLWRRGSRYSRDDTADSSDAGFTPSLRSGTTTESLPSELWGAVTIEEQDPEPGDDRANLHLLPVRSASTRGLWGGESIKRERSPGKRRWTAVERSP